MSLESFKSSSVGAAIAPVVASPEVIARMERLSREGRPAVGALDEALAGRVELDDTEKQHVGRWIRDVLGERGWRPLKQKRLSGGRLFSSGSVYGRIGPAAAGADAAADAADAGPATGGPAERLEAARALVRRARRRDYGVREFIADKRREAAAEE